MKGLLIIIRGSNIVHRDFEKVIEFSIIVYFPIGNEGIVIIITVQIQCSQSYEVVYKRDITIMMRIFYVLKRIESQSTRVQLILPAYSRPVFLNMGPTPHRRAIRLLRGAIRKLTPMATFSHYSSLSSANN